MSTKPISSRIVGRLPVRDTDEVAATIPADASLLVSGFGSVGYPKAIPLELAADDRDLSLTVVSSGSIGAEIDTELVKSNSVERRFPYQSRSESRREINQEHIAFHDRNISDVSDEVQYKQLVDPDVAIIEAIAIGEDWLIPSTSVGHTPAFVESTDRIIVEVNHAQPLALQTVHDIYRPGTPPNREPIPLSAPDERIGSPRISFDPDALDAIVETNIRDDPYSFRKPSAAEETICGNLMSFLLKEVERSAVFEDSIRLQFGVGSLGNALMSAINDADFGDHDLIYYGEVIQDGLLDLIDSGSLSTASATSLALSEEGQNRMFEHMERYTKDIILRPADVSNSPAVIDRFGIIGVNSALEVDLYSHINSTHIDGSRLINGIGGSGDFNRNSLITVTALPSITDKGDISRVVPMVKHVDHTEHDIDIIVTEQGVADLRGLSPRERAVTIIENCAHPSFESDLHRYLGCADGGHIPHDLDSAFTWQDA